MFFIHSHLGLQFLKIIFCFENYFLLNVCLKCFFYFKSRITHKTLNLDNKKSFQEYQNSVIYVLKNIKRTNRLLAPFEPENTNERKKKKKEENKIWRKLYIYSNAFYLFIYLLHND